MQALAKAGKLEAEGGDDEDEAAGSGGGGGGGSGRGTAPLCGGGTPLMMACCTEEARTGVSAELVQLLLQSKAAVDLPDVPSFPKLECAE